MAEDPRLLVVDVCVLGACSTKRKDKDSEPGRSEYCTDFLKAIRKICHHIVLTPEIRTEYNKCRSKFASKWRKSMFHKRKLHWIPETVDDNLRTEMEGAASDENDLKVVEEDIHLIDAALRTDRCVISLDEKARGFFAQSSKKVAKIKDIVWVNPEKTEERPISWLEKGAKPEKKRTLGFQATES